MPDGVVQWFDPSSGEGVIRRGGRRYAVRAEDMEPVARVGGARVHFDVARDEGVLRAERVSLRSGSRVNRRQSRFGDLAGARAPAATGGEASSRTNPDPVIAYDHHPARAVEDWADLLTDGLVDDAVLQCAPDVALHADGEDLAGTEALRRWWDRSPVLGKGVRAAVTGAGPDSFDVRWEEPAAVVVRVRVAHGLIAEQWDEAAGAGTPVEAEGAPELGTIEISSSGVVRSSDLAYAEDKLAKVLADIGRPVLHTDIRLEKSADPSLERPAMARIIVLVDGEPVRASVQAAELTEAIDLLEARIRRRITQMAEARQALRRRGPTSPTGQWRRGDAPTERPPYLPRPAAEREIVRRKTFTTAEATIDEAIFDMESLDHDFFLFTDLASGQDAVVHRRDDGSYGLLYADGPGDDPLEPTAAAVAVQPEAASRQAVDEARDNLDMTGAPWLFFVDVETDRGQVLYRRLDGHYGLITPAG